MNPVELFPKRSACIRWQTLVHIQWQLYKKKQSQSGYTDQISRLLGNEACRVQL